MKIDVRNFECGRSLNTITFLGGLMKKFSIPAIIFAAVGLVAAANVAPSRVHPGTISLAQTPQFVCLGSDDNYYPDGLNWIVKLIQSKTNPTENPVVAGTFDGMPATMSFYPNTDNSEWYDIIDTTDVNEYGADSALKIQASLREALAHGSEIGSHTKHHMSSTSSTLAYWYTEMDSSLKDLKTIGFPTASIVGFRTPFLQYNDFTFKALDSLKNFKYDCSIESGLDDATDGTNFVWPYTLDNGPFTGDTGFLAATDRDTIFMNDGELDTETIMVKIGNHPGLWEAPVYCVIVPPALRHKIWLQTKDTIAVQLYKHNPDGTIATNRNGDAIDSVVVPDSVFSVDFDTTTGKITGLDYNMWSAPANDGVGMDSAEFVETMKYTLDRHLSGNRAPFNFGMHSNIFYDTSGFIDESAQQYGSMTSPPRATVTQMRNAMNAFIDYAISKPAVRFVSQSNMINWCANPVPLSVPLGVVNNVSSILAKEPVVSYVAGKIIVRDLPTRSHVTVSLYNVLGKRVDQVTASGSSLVWKQGSRSAGTYILKIAAPGLVRTKSIVME